jgi:hypothetical protein
MGTNPGRKAFLPGEPEEGLMSQATQTFQALTRIAIAREKLISEAGFDQVHDDAQLQSQLVVAAGSYALHAIASEAERQQFSPGAPPPAWPWEATLWQPEDRNRDLLRAAALLVAEIERLNRLKPESVDAQLQAAKAPVNTFGSGPLPIGPRPQ